MKIPQIKLLLIICFLILIFSSVISLFYQEQIKTLLPAETPIGYVPTVYGQVFDIKASKKLKLIHFFNPDCPCSKFNTKHIKYLAEKYKDQVEFVAYSSKDIPKDYPIKVLKDANGAVAQKLGVYSTPQAVLLDAAGTLLYRGNYNKSRYCSNKSSEYVDVAIENALNKNISSSLMQTAGKPYGCPIKL